MRNSKVEYRAKGNDIKQASAMAQAGARPFPAATPCWSNSRTGIAWVTMNRPEKRNAISPALAAEMLDVLDALEADRALPGARAHRRGRCVLRRHGPEGILPRQPTISRRPSARRSIAPTPPGSGASCSSIRKPTIAMVNGWCFGGAFTPLVSCDLAIAAEEATFGLSEINWGIIPGRRGHARRCRR